MMRMVFLSLLLLAVLVYISSAEKKSVRYVFLCQKSGSGNPYERAWIADYLLQDCTQDMICWYDLHKAFAAKQFDVVRPYMQPGTVFFFQLDIKDIYSYLVADLMQMMSQFDRRFADFTLVHMSDQQQSPHNATIYGHFYRRWRQVFRNYHWDEPFMRELEAAGDLHYFPLGYSSHMKTTGYIDYDRRGITGASKAKLYGQPQAQTMLRPGALPHIMSFLGNRKSGNNKRGDHLKEIEHGTGLNVTGQVRYDGFGKGSAAQYVEYMRSSKLCISLRGQFVECYRLYDALEAGCVPVIIDDFKLKNYVSQHTEQLRPLLTFPWTNARGQLVAAVGDSATGGGGSAGGRANYQDFNTGGGGMQITAPFIYVRNVAEFSALLDRLLGSQPSLLDDLQAENVLWWGQVKQHYRALFTEKLCF